MSSNMYSMGMPSMQSLGFMNQGNIGGYQPFYQDNGFWNNFYSQNNIQPQVPTNMMVPGFEWAYNQQQPPQVTGMSNTSLSGGMPSLVPQNGFQFGQNFGKKLMTQGTLGQGGRQQIKQAGYSNLKDFMTQNPNFRQDYASNHAMPEANTMRANNPGRRNTPAVIGQPAQTDWQRQNPAMVAAGVNQPMQSANNTITQPGEMQAANPGRRYR